MSTGVAGDGFLGERREAVAPRSRWSSPGSAMTSPVPGLGIETARLAVTVALLTGIVGIFVTVGADARWLAALGHLILARGSVPAGVPFAAGPTVHWQNTLVLAELAFAGLESAFGDRGLALAELVAVAAALTILARDARAALGAGAGAVPVARGIPAALTIVVIGALPSLAVVRVQLFSLVLFPLLLALLRAEARAPSRRIWLALALLALWSNLHGAALSGLLVLEVHLILARARRDPARALAIAALAPVALCLTPAGIGTIAYYHGLLTNAAAERGLGQWAPLGSTPLDLLLIGATAILVARAVAGVRARPRPRGEAALWELVLVLAFAGLTVKAARDGVWLLFLLVAPAAHARPARRAWTGMIPVGAAAAVALLAIAVARPPRAPGASRAIVARAVRLAAGAPILADAIPAEQVALAGGRIWAGNPLDAFTRSTQLAYLAWSDGSAGARRLLDDSGIRLVLADRGSAAAATTAADPAFRAVAADASAVLFERR